MTTDKINIKSDTITDNDDVNQNPNATAEVEKPGDDAGHPLQKRQPSEAKPDAQAHLTGDDIGLPIGNKGKSPGNGG